jgi:hypothetical protein
MFVQGAQHEEVEQQNYAGRLLAALISRARARAQDIREEDEWRLGGCGLCGTTEKIKENRESFA